MNETPHVVTFIKGRCDLLLRNINIVHMNMIAAIKFFTDESCLLRRGVGAQSSPLTRFPRDCSMAIEGLPLLAVPERLGLETDNLGVVLVVCVRRRTLAAQYLIVYCGHISLVLGVGLQIGPHVGSLRIF